MIALVKGEVVEHTIGCAPSELGPDRASIDKHTTGYNSNVFTLSQHVQACRLAYMECKSVDGKRMVNYSAPAPEAPINAVRVPGLT